MILITGEQQYRSILGAMREGIDFVVDAEMAKIKLSLPKFVPAELKSMILEQTTPADIMSYQASTVRKFTELARCYSPQERPALDIATDDFFYLFSIEEQVDYTKASKQLLEIRSLWKGSYPWTDLPTVRLVTAARQLSEHYETVRRIAVGELEFGTEDEVRRLVQNLSDTYSHTWEGRFGDPDEKPIEALYGRTIGDYSTGRAFRDLESIKSGQGDPFEQASRIDKLPGNFSNLGPIAQALRTYDSVVRCGHLVDDGKFPVYCSIG